ncbi:hypothetical protein Tco_0976594 [Tanacetum coccineum]|uniref:Uncharacterized protein n=1 Tax=Tanacetum coccineum TaxID=301880 RepID=A0ABQ5EI44_9ASTR
MAKLFAYDSDILLEVPNLDTYQANNNVIDQSMQEIQYSKQPDFINESDIDTISDSNVISYDQYLKETKNEVVQDTTSSAQQYAMIMFVIEETSNQIAKWMYKLDLEPLSIKLRKNREAYVDYLKQTKEHADTLRDIVEQARAQQPFDSALDFSCKFITRIQEFLVYVNATFPSFINKNEKLVAIPPMNKSKKVRFAEPSESASNTLKQADLQNFKITNKPLSTSTRVKSSTNASRSKPSGNTKKNRISRTSSSIQKNKVEEHLRSFKSSLNKKNHVSECNASTNHVVFDVNSKLVCSTCNECLLNACHDMCVVDYLNNVNDHARSSSSKRNKKKD